MWIILLYNRQNVKKETASINSMCDLTTMFYHHDLITVLLTNNSVAFLLQTSFILTIILFRWPAWCKESTSWPKPPSPWTGDWVASPGEWERRTDSCLQGGWSCECDWNEINKNDSEQECYASLLFTNISTEWVALQKAFSIFSNLP